MDLFGVTVWTVVEFHSVSLTLVSWLIIVVWWCGGVEEFHPVSLTLVSWVNMVVWWCCDVEEFHPVTVTVISCVECGGVEEFYPVTLTVISWVECGGVEECGGGVVSRQLVEAAGTLHWIPTLEAGIMFGTL